MEELSAYTTPGKAIRSYCLHCVGGGFTDVWACDANNPKYHTCPFHPYRLGKGRPSVKAIRKFCLLCMGNHADFVLDCQTTDCLCHPYRMGKNPKRKGIGKSSAEMMVVRAGKKEMSNVLPCSFERSLSIPTLIAS